MSTEITFYGHATFHVDVDGTDIWVDPFLTDNPLSPIDGDDVEDADYILLTHGHGDHVGDTVEIAKRLDATVIANFEIVNWLQDKGIENAHPQHIGGAFDHPFGNLKMTPALHGSGLPDGSYGGMPGGLKLRTQAGETVYFAGDTALFSDMKLIGEDGIDLAFIPIGDNFTMGPEDALRAVDFLGPNVVVPIHYNTWPLIEQDAEGWARKVDAQTSTEARVLAPGDSITVGG